MKYILYVVLLLTAMSSEVLAEDARTPIRGIPLDLFCKGMRSTVCRPAGKGKWKTVDDDVERFDMTLNPSRFDEAAGMITVGEGKASFALAYGDILNYYLFQYTSEPGRGARDGARCNKRNPTDVQPFLNNVDIFQVGLKVAANYFSTKVENAFKRMEGSLSGFSVELRASFSQELTTALAKQDDFVINAELITIQVLGNASDANKELLEATSCKGRNVVVNLVGILVRDYKIKSSGDFQAAVNTAYDLTVGADSKVAELNVNKSASFKLEMGRRLRESAMRTWNVDTVSSRPYFYPLYIDSRN